MDTELVERAKEVARRRGTYTASGIARELVIAWDVGHKIRCILEDDNAFNGELLVIRDRLEHEAERRSEDEKRQARWHATYNAALKGAMGRDRVFVGEWHLIAHTEADRAHGPLEASGPRPLMTPAELMRFGQVAELVRAATRLSDCMSRGDVYGGAEAHGEVMEALKPFEVTT